jgi:hypothetical protein
MTRFAQSTCQYGSRLVIGVCVLAIAFAPGQIRAGDPEQAARDDVQIPSLFDHVRDRMRELKRGMRLEEARRFLCLDRLSRQSGWDGGQIVCTYFHGFSKESQSLAVMFSVGKESSTIVSVILRDGDKTVAKFDADGN